MTCRSQEASSRWSLLQGVVVFAGVVLVAVVVLLVAAVAAAIGLSVGLVVMPWLMALVWLFTRHRRELPELSGGRRGRAVTVRDRGDVSLTGPGRGPIPVH